MTTTYAESQTGGKSEVQDTSNQLTGCNVCGQRHSTEQCPFLSQLQPVQDTKTPSKARLTLPANLVIEDRDDGTTTVVAQATFLRGTQFGPFQAKKVQTQPSGSFPLKIFRKAPEESCYLDVSDEDACNWMCLVAPARNAKEQNLICYQMKDDIYYTVMKDIHYEDELKVWYAPYYAVKIGVATLVVESNISSDHLYESKAKDKKILHEMLLNREVTEKIVEHLPPKHLGVRKVTDTWKCKLCNAEESRVVSFAKHLMEHYKPSPWRGEKTFQCHFCKEKFTTEKLLLHHKVKEHKIAVRRQRLLESEDEAVESSEQNITDIVISSIGGPDVISDSDQKGQIILINNPSGVSCNQAVILLDEQQSTNSISNLLEQYSNTEETSNSKDGTSGVSDIPQEFMKEVKLDEIVSIARGGEQQNLEIISPADVQEVSEDDTLLIVKTQDDSGGEHSGDPLSIGPPYNCDICNKEFHKSEYLYRHLRKHTGEFTCVSCFAVFARKENLLTHSCFGEVAADPLPCPHCSKTFTVKKLLKRHIAKHTGEFTCRCCHRSYSSKIALTAHKCTKKKSELPLYKCSICGKEFLRQSYLQRHIPLHSDSHICKICGKALRSPESLETHEQYCGQVKQFETTGHATCHHCNAVFSQLSTYKQHVLEHTHPYVCQECGARFKCNKSINIHACNEEKFLQCEVCMKQFPSAFTLNRHELTHGEPKYHCFECGKSYYRAEGLAKHPCEQGRFDIDKRKNPKKSKSIPEKSEKEAKLICDVCGARYKTVYSLKSHMQLHGERRFECDICHKRFHRKDVLQEHRTVHQDPQIPCIVCGKKVKTKKSLDVHMLIHNGERKYRCEECGKEFYQKGNLMKHSLVHEPAAKKHLTCLHCGKNFTSKEYLNVHLLEHTQGRIHECGLCGKSFVKERLLKAHHKHYHGNQMYVCQFCGLSVRLRHSMRRHLEHKHESLKHIWESPRYIESLLSTTSGQVEVPVPTEHAQIDSTASAALSMPEAINIRESETQGAEILLTVAGMATEELQCTMDVMDEKNTISIDPSNIHITVPHLHKQDDDDQSMKNEIAGSLLNKLENAVVGSHDESIAQASDQCVEMINQNSNEIVIDGNTYILEDGSVLQHNSAQTDILLYVLCNDISGEPAPEEPLDL